MAQNRKLIIIEVDLGHAWVGKEPIGIATNVLEAYKIIEAFRQIEKADESRMSISGGLNDNCTGNYHRFIQSLSTEGKVDLCALPFIFRTRIILSNQLITNQNLESWQKKKIKKKAPAKKQSKKRLK